MSQSGFFTTSVAQSDPELAKAIDLELGRQRHEIELIASENIVSKAVLEVQGSVLTNKYAEGYPGKRYYGGCQFVDIAENLALDRAKKLLAALMPMFSLIPDHRLTRLSFSHCCSLATPIWALILQQAAILLMAHPSMFLAVGLSQWLIPFVKTTSALIWIR